MLEFLRQRLLRKKDMINQEIIIVVALFILLIIAIMWDYMDEED